MYSFRNPFNLFHASIPLVSVTFLFLTNLIDCAPSRPASSLETNDPVLIVDGQNLSDKLGIQITVSIFLIIAYIDFIFQSVLFLYVFFRLIISSRKCSEFFYASFGLIIYLILRASFVPFFILPIPWDWVPTLPSLYVQIFIYINMTMFIVFYTISAGACLYYIFFIGVTGKKLAGSIVDSKTGIQPMVVILMPIYNEEPDALFRAVESAIRCNYRPDRLHVFLAFDEASETPLYFALLKKLKVLSKEVSEEIKLNLENVESYSDEESNKEENKKKPIEIFPPKLEWYIEGVRVTICRFPHEGKSPTQGKAFKIINDNYGSDATSANTLILFIDSDIILHENAIHNFVQPAVANPKIKGMTGLVTCRTSRNFNIYQYMQDSEYIDGQMFNRTAEAFLGAVTCLPGALTLIRLNALQKVASKYFIEIDKSKTVDFHRFHLGEDRYMTYLLTEEADGPYQVKFVSNATCKTDAPDTFTKLLKQRRRWFLGGFVNDVSTLISPVMWTKVPLVVLMKTHFYSSKGIDWIFPVMIISLAVNQNPGLAMYVLVGVFLVRYLLICFNALIMMRNKVCVSYIFLFFLSPMFNWIVTIYAVWTWSVRSWGGPRTDGDEDKQVSPAKVLEEAMAQKEEGAGKTRRSLAQIETVSRIIDSNMRQGNPMGSIKSFTSNKGNRGKNEPPIKKFVPFPYETEFLGGGGLDSNTVILVAPSPRLSLISLQPQIPSMQNQSMLSPEYTLNNGGRRNQSLKDESLIINQSSSMPDLHLLSQSNVPYLFSKLSLDIQRKVSSFKLDTDYLAKVEELATLQDSGQRGSSFNLRLSGRSTPNGSIRGYCSSRESSVMNFEINDSRASSISGDTSYNDIVPSSSLNNFIKSGDESDYISDWSGRKHQKIDIIIHLSEDN